jgi:hypothetical protein
MVRADGLTGSDLSVGRHDILSPFKKTCQRPRERILQKWQSACRRAAPLSLRCRAKDIADYLGVTIETVSGLALSHCCRKTGAT